ncbi:MAG: hypothetical protein ACRD0H_01135, partial [Actinomycetes bacterium]
RQKLAIAEYSIYQDRISRLIGATANSILGLNPHSGLTGRLLHTTLAMTFATNLIGHISLAVGSGGLPFLTNLSYAFSDAIFGAHAVASAAGGWAGYDAGAHPVFRFMLQIPGFFVLTAANLLLSVQFGLAGNLIAAVSAAVLTATTAYVLNRGVALELNLGRQAPKRGAAANFVIGSSLIALGLINLNPGNLAIQLVGVAIGASVPIVYIGRGLWNRIAQWLPTRSAPNRSMPTGPPGGGPHGPTSGGPTSGGDPTSGGGPTSGGPTSGGGPKSSGPPSGGSGHTGRSVAGAARWALAAAGVGAVLLLGGTVAHGEWSHPATPPAPSTSVSASATPGVGSTPVVA